MSGDLPTGWAVAQLDTLGARYRGVSYARGDASPNARKGFIPILRANNIAGDRLVFEELVFVPPTCVSAVQYIQKGDVLIAMSSGSKSVVGKSAQAMENWEGAFGAFCGVLRPSSALNARYLGLYLRTQYYRHKISELAAGTNINNLKAEHFSEIDVPLAPLAEQKRIVAKVEKLLERVDASRARVEKIPILLKRFRQSVLAAACSGHLTADWREQNPTEDQSGASRKLLLEERSELFDTPDSWFWTNLDHVCSKITDGEHLTPPITGQGVPLLSAKDVRDNYLDFTDVKHVSDEFSKKSRIRCNPEFGDILVVSRGATVGRTCRIQVTDVFCLMGSVLLFKPDGRYVLPQMMEFIFKSPYGLAALISTSSSTAQPAIYIKDMKNFHYHPIRAKWGHESA